MNIREILEAQDEERLSPFAVKSNATKGRKRTSEKCDIRTEFQRDRDKITHSKAFRRLMHKTQVFISPEGDHFRTRLTHTLEVSQISRTIARGLKLNEDLTEAIALSHDLGHTPYGHMGEEVLSDIMQELLGTDFHHNQQSVRVVDKIENNGNGLNLTWEVLDGILHHRGSGAPQTLEGKVVQLSDKIAYINHDIDDAIRSGFLKEGDLPQECTEVLGRTSSHRIDLLIKDCIYQSYDKNEILLSKEVKSAMSRLRAFLFENLYLSQPQILEKQRIHQMLRQLYMYFYENPEKMSPEFVKMLNRDEDKAVVVCDFIAGMTDRYAKNLFSSIYMPAVF